MEVKSFGYWRSGRRGDNIHRLGLGWLQGDSKVVERRRDNAWLSCFESNTRKQNIIARRSAEAGLYTAALGASESKGIVSLLRGLGYEMKPVLAIDAKATEHILHRQGIGKLKHIDVAYLWVQDEIGSKRLRVRRVKSEENVADLGTKPLSKAVITKRCLTLGYVNMAEENGASVRASSRAAIFW